METIGSKKLNQENKWMKKKKRVFNLYSTQYGFYVCSEIDRWTVGGKDWDHLVFHTLLHLMILVILFSLFTV